MSYLNDVTIMGNLGQHPDVRFTQDNLAVANMSLATNKKYRNKQGDMVERTEWHRVVAWGKLAEIAQNYLSKGKRVMVKGELQTRKWQDKEGITRYTTEIKADNLILIDFDNGAAGYSKEYGRQEAEPAGREDEQKETADDELPF